MNPAANQFAPVNDKHLLEFPTQLRAQVELIVSDLTKSVQFYQSLFNKQPSQMSSASALFNPYNPCVDFRITESKNASRRDGHLGIQLKTSTDIQRYKNRVEKAGFNVQLEEAETACCFSVANKAWIEDPDGNQWEIFVVTSENTSEVRCGDSCACEAEGCG